METTTFAPPQVISISTNATMQVFVLLAIVAAASAAPTADKAAPKPDVAAVPTFMMNAAPIAHIGGAMTYSHAIPSTFYSSSWNSANVGAIPTTYVSGSAGVPTTYLAGNNFPMVYNAGAFSPLTYSGNVVSPAVIPKYFAETEGTRHIVN